LKKSTKYKIKSNLSLKWRKCSKSNKFRNRI